MANEPDYKCTTCNESPGRDLLTVKRVQFTHMGKGSKTMRSRVVAWKCPLCVSKDPDWNRPAYDGIRVAPVESRVLTPVDSSDTILPSGKERI